MDTVGCIGCTWDWALTYGGPLAFVYYTLASLGAGLAMLVALYNWYADILDEALHTIFLPPGDGPPTGPPSLDPWELQPGGSTWYPGEGQFPPGTGEE